MFERRNVIVKIKRLFDQRDEWNQEIQAKIAERQRADFRGGEFWRCRLIGDQTVDVPVLQSLKEIVKVEWLRRISKIVTENL